MGFLNLKAQLTAILNAEGYKVADFGAHTLVVGDDYPDYVESLVRAGEKGEVVRGVVICGSGFGACVVANKVPDVRASLIYETFSVHQGVEGDDMNMICLGGLVVGHALAWEFVKVFLQARFSGSERFQCRLAKVATLEHKEAT